MAKQPVWRRCITCMERFEAPDEWSMNKLFESHKVSTDKGQKCMGEAQLNLSFRRDGKAWVKK